jgi:hypothetical protein
MRWSTRFIKRLFICHSKSAVVHGQALIPEGPEDRAAYFAGLLASKVQ